MFSISSGIVLWASASTGIPSSRKRRIDPWFSCPAYTTTASGRRASTASTDGLTPSPTLGTRDASGGWSPP